MGVTLFPQPDSLLRMRVLIRSKNGFGVRVSQDDKSHDGEPQSYDDDLVGPEATFEADEVFLLVVELILIGLVDHSAPYYPQNKTNLLLLSI